MLIVTVGQCMIKTEVHSLYINKMRYLSKKFFAYYLQIIMFSRTQASNFLHVTLIVLS